MVNEVKITFRTHDGRCPYFNYDGVMYYIQEQRNNQSPTGWEYALFSQKKGRLVKNFKNDGAKVVERYLDIFINREVFPCDDCVYGYTVTGEECMYPDTLDDYCVMGDKRIPLDGLLKAHS